MNPNQIQQRINLYEKLMRLDKPIGILLLLWPTLWALWIAGYGHPEWLLVWIFILGTVLMRSAGCVINDYADRHFDSHVERTRDRPLAAKLVSTKEALLLAAGLTLLAFLLVLQLNRLTIYLSFAAVFLAATYPLTKRFFSIPQIYLGIAFGFGIPMAFAAQLEQIPSIAWWLLTANIFWSIAYDTEYAMVDKEDDARICIHSSALFFGRFDLIAIIFCYIAMLSIMTYVGLTDNMKWPYFTGLIFAATLACYHIKLIRSRERSQCFKAFLHNNWIGATIFAGIVANYLL